MLGLFLHHKQSLASSIKAILVAPFASLLTCVVLAIALALPTGLFVALHNLEKVGAGFSDNVTLTLYLNKTNSNIAVDNLKDILSNNNQVAKLSYISPKQGLQEFEQQFGLNDIFSLFDDNPLPGAMLVTLKAKAYSKDDIASIKNDFSHLPGVNNVQVDWQWLERLFAILHLFKQVVFMLSVFFAGAVLLIIGNTIRLITQRHQQEIKVTRLIGGTHAFVRRPFIYTGICYSLFGGLLAWLFVFAGISWLQHPVDKIAGLYGFSFHLQMLNVEQTLALLGISILLGYIGAYFAVHRELRQIEAN